LEEIDEDEYLALLRELVRKKYSEIKGGKKLTVRNKIFTFVSGKGFESDLISEAINELKI
jgi:regulatory protein